MFKKSLLSFFLLALATQAYGLGLGNLNVNSYLEQPLDISLPLIVTKNDDLNTLVVSAASQSEFDSAGILRQSFVNDLSFQVDRKGINPYIKITSKKPIQDPFIHLLIRFKWNSGELLREYTALIDPPVYAAESPTPVASPKTIGKDIVKTDSVSSSTASTSAVTSSASSDSSAQSSISDDVDSYGPISAGESLSMIAKQIQDRYPDLSIYQIMYVLYRNNKTAFIDDNINQLIKGSLLNVGDINNIQSVDINDGKELFFEHLSRWTESTVSEQQFAGDSDPIKVSGNTTSGETANVESTSTGDDEKADSKEFQVGSSELQSASQLSGSSSDAADIALLQQKLIQAESELSNSVLENNELQERIDLLEDQLADVNKLLELQSTTGAEIVSNIEKAQDQEIETQVVEEVETQAVQEEAQAVQEEAQAVQEETQVEEIVAEEELIAETEEEIVESPIVTPITEDVEVPTPVVDKQPLTIVDKIKNVLGASWMYILGGLGALLLLLVGFAISRNRRSDNDFEESVSGISDMVLDTKTESTTVSADFKTAETTVTKESSFLTVYSDSEVVVHADEIDPIAEADVYIAYGRDEQGEEVLLEGIRKFPNRPDIKVSLLKLHMKRKDITKFDALAEELYASGENDNPDIWNKVVEMGSVLSPENPLYAGDGSANTSENSETQLIDLDDSSESGVSGGVAAASATAVIAAAASEAESLLDDKDDLNVDFDSVELDLEDAVDVVDNNIEAESAEIDALDDIILEDIAADDILEHDIADIGVEDLAAEDPVEADEEIEFENTDFEIGTEVTINVDDEMSEVSISDDDSYGSLEDDDIDIASVVEFDNYDQLTEVDVDLDKNDFSERSTQEIVEEAIAKEVTRDEDFEPNIEGAGVDFDEPLSIQLEDVTLDVTADAEIADPNTQLELARVFVELDDVSGAKEILEALVDTDDKDVKKEAVKLLKSIS